MASEGDPRVLFVMNLVLSTAFAAFVVWGLSLVTNVAFGLQTVATLALVLMAITHLVTR